MSADNMYYEIAVGSGAAVVAANDANVKLDRSAFVQIQGTGNNVRMRTDGTAPTIAIGWLIPPDSPISLVLSEADLKSAQFIAETGTATLRVMRYIKH